MAARLPPGPPVPALVQTALWFGRPAGFLAWCGRRYGDVFTLRLALGPPIVMVSEPRLVERVLALTAEAASTGEENALLAPLLGERSVLMLDGPEHLRQRRLLLPYFHGERMRRQGDAIASIVRQEVARWPVGRPFPLLPRMRDVTFEVILRVVFGLEDSARLDELRGALVELLRMGGSWMAVPALRRDVGPFRPWGRFLDLKARVDGLLGEEIRRRRAAGGPPGDGAIDQLLPEMDDRELADALMTMLVAGHETTATSLAWCFELLLRRPDLVTRLRAGDSRLLDAVVRETLRLRPVFRYTSRRLRQPLALGAYTIPAGVPVGAGIFLAHHRPATYGDATAFRPERFLDGPPAPGTWVPFGGGVRRCVGASFAAYEMGVVVRTVLESAALRPASARPERIVVRAITLVPSRGARVVLERRPGASPAPGEP
ncbi:MAG TPA: cytochrome P450 [Candidatus Dormibacteraeota bacterium]|nr:cytochrome P450 [Candidatus Dormibacteraeota bacterium]